MLSVSIATSLRVKSPVSAPLYGTVFLSNELGCLAQGVGNRVRDTNKIRVIEAAIRFVEAVFIPTNKAVSYGLLVSNLKPHKTEKQRMRLTLPTSPQLRYT